MLRLGGLGRLGVAMFSGLALGGGTARAQYGYDGGYSVGQYSAPAYRPVASGVSIQVGLGSGVPAPFVPAGVGYPYGAILGSEYARPGCSGGAVPGYGYPAPASPGYAAYPSPAGRQGYREGQLYWETGVAPNRPLSPAEARGFAAGERRAASAPWQLDPARQQGYREGQLYWETGIAPNRPMTPAEAQGFRAGEVRAASGGYYSPYR